ncbi:MAG: AarF/ABC1/UbiB kinase family protein, partial [Pseudomonadota bacterium]|nr:AarF/ABC1/UbiB kinase family protein [Pseudomonadota bacterium]
MDDDDNPKRRHRAIPSSRAARLGAFGRLAGGVASGMLGEGARRLARGERPRMRDLVLTPGNVGRLADRLSHLRGAAMKLGQMISMDAGDLLPPELAAILGQLRSQAHRMPPEQLRRVLDSEWGPDWRRRFARFNATPIAAASIGQVHRATLPDGRELAIKVQYPGVRESIDSDVDNVATLLRVSGVLPRELDLAPLLTEAKRQLHEEADYEREAAQMIRFADWLDGHADYVVPRPLPELTTARVLAMDFIDGIPIEALADAPQEQRDAAMRDLMALVLREMFEFGAMQTDPNFANYRFQPDAGRLVLLDFGAARDVDPATAQGYRSLLSAGLSGDRDEVSEAARAAGFLGEAAVARHRPLVDRMIDIVVTEMSRPGPFDFGDRGFVEVLREPGMEMAADRST